MCPARLAIKHRTNTSHNFSMERLIDHLYQRVPIADIKLPQGINFSELLTSLETIAETNPYYIKTFLSQRLFKLPEMDQDEFYELFSNVVSAKPKLATDIDVIRYNINGIKINIKETPRLISGAGTTGLRTWEAALYLANYLRDSPEVLKDKTVLELGSGTGLVGLSILKNEEIMETLKELIITDGDSNLVESLTHTFKENEINPQEISNLRCTSLWWGRDQIPSKDVNLIIAADVTYDTTVIPHLVQCLKQGLESGAERALIAATVRNEDTVKVFEENITQNHLRFDIVSSAKDPHSELAEAHRTFYPTTSTEIRIYSIEP